MKKIHIIESRYQKHPSLPQEKRWDLSDVHPNRQEKEKNKNRSIDPTLNSLRFSSESTYQIYKQVEYPHIVKSRYNEDNHLYYKRIETYDILKKKIQRIKIQIDGTDFHNHQIH